MIARVDKQLTQTLLLLAGLAIAALALDVWEYGAHQRGRHTWFEGAVCTVSYPLQRVLLRATWRAEEIWYMAVHRRELAEDNARLTARVASLESRLSRLQESYAEEERERALRSAYPRVQERNALAQVIGVHAGGWLSYFTVDRGSAHGVGVGDVAVTRNGLVGQVYAVTSQTARVLPFTDPAAGVAVRVQRSRETGILKGLGEWECEMRYLDPDADVGPGDQVLTAGSGGVFPKGIRVGTVTSVMADPYTPGKIAAVEPASELRKIEEVLLLGGRG